MGVAPAHAFGVAAKQNTLSLLLHDFLRLLVRDLLDSALENLEEVLHFFLAGVAFVLGHLFVLFGLIEVLVAVTANISDRKSVV